MMLLLILALSLYSTAIKSQTKDLAVVPEYRTTEFAGTACNPGDFDPSFGVGGILAPVFQDASRANSIVIQPDGKIVIAGDTGRFGSSTGDDFGIFRYTTSGELDLTFGNGTGAVVTDFHQRADIARALALQADGKIVVVGHAYHNSGVGFAVARYNFDGSLDPTFDVDGKVTTAFTFPAEAYALTIQADGKIVVVGGTNVARYNPDGTLDSTFGIGGKVTTILGAGWTRATAVSTGVDGKVIVGGFFSKGSDANFVVVRYNSDGSLDGTFSGDGIAYNDIPGSQNIATSMVVQNDGKIVLAGYNDHQFGKVTFLQINPNPTVRRFSLMRFKADGEIDLSYGHEGMVETVFGGDKDEVTSIVIQPDQRIVALGHGWIDGKSRFALARYTTDGFPDFSFGQGGKLSFPILNSADFALAGAIQQDGKLIVGGMSHNPTVNRHHISLVRLFGINCGSANMK